MLVDGYNIIFAWEDLKEAAEDNLEQARDLLLEKMSNYQGYTKITVIVVFDAHKVKKNTGSISRYHNINVVYTKEAETADQYIEKVAHVIGRDYKVRVATSDFLEQTIILGKGATRISARELQNEVKNLEQKMRNEFIEKNVVKRNKLEAHLAPEVIALMEKLRRE